MPAKKASSGSKRKKPKKPKDGGGAPSGDAADGEGSSSRAPPASAEEDAKCAEIEIAMADLVLNWGDNGGKIGHDPDGTGGAGGRDGSSGGGLSLLAVDAEGEGEDAWGQLDDQYKHAREANLKHAALWRELDELIPRRDHWLSEFEVS